MPSGDPKELKRFGYQVLLAIVRFAALLLFMGMHWLLARFSAEILPGRAKDLLEAIFGIAFVLLYVDQVFEMLAIFIPRLRPLHGRLTRANN